MSEYIKRKCVGGAIRPRVIYCGRAGRKGIGVFAGESFKKGDSIEECEVIFFPKKEVPYLKKTQIECYYYCWKGGSAVLPLGFGALYNHSSHANAEWTHNYQTRRMIMIALVPIKKGEEITVDYMLTPDETWFKAID